MATDWFAGREIVTAMSIMLTSWPVGIAAGLLVFAPLAKAQGWAWVMHLAAGACCLALLLLAGGYRSPGPVTIAQVISVPIRSAFSLLTMVEALPIIAAGLIWGSLHLGLIVFQLQVQVYLRLQGSVINRVTRMF